jgi:hypothetical protein
MRDPQRYLQVERRIFAHAGLDVDERMIELRRVRGKARLLAVGQGDPLLLLAGGPNVAATFALLAAELRGFRCLLLDRPARRCPPLLTRAGCGPTWLSSWPTSSMTCR